MPERAEGGSAGGLADARRSKRRDACARAWFVGRRRAQRALRIEDGRLRAGIRADAGRLRRVRLGPEAGSDRPHLARRGETFSPLVLSPPGGLPGGPRPYETRPGGL